MALRKRSTRRSRTLKRRSQTRTNRRKTKGGKRRRKTRNRRKKTLGKRKRTKVARRKRKSRKTKRRRKRRMRGGGDAHVSMPSSFQLEMNKMLIDLMSSEETFESFKSGCCENYTEWVKCAEKWGAMKWISAPRSGGQ